MEFNAAMFRRFSSFIFKTTGITISESRLSMLEGRIRKRLHALSLTSYETYFDLLENNSVELEKFIDAITTNETYFYRTPRIWEEVELNFIPNFFSNSNKKLIAWCCASSSGEEPYTLSFILENFKEKNTQFDYEIDATDISSEMVQLCIEAQYKGRSVENLYEKRKDLFQKYLVQKGDFFSVGDSIRKKIFFKKHNLMNALESEKNYDLILIRNVLIYFKNEEIEKVIHHVSKKMNPNGLLIIGESESLNYLNTPFKMVEPMMYKIKGIGE